MNLFPFLNESARHRGLDLLAQIPFFELGRDPAAVTQTPERALLMDGVNQDEYAPLEQVQCFEPASRRQIRPVMRHRGHSIICWA